MFLLKPYRATSRRLSLTILVLVGSFNYSIQLSALSKNRTTAMADARQIAEQVRITADSGLAGLNTTQWNDFLSGAIPNETVQVTTAGTDPVDATIVINWNEKGRTESLQYNMRVTNR